ncbi:transcriptional regulator [Pseudomonas sp. GM78]|uniref:TetR/AcrR family transcriptional regulator n=1 Tax=Pseudomonas sp. GM78 TaxID=1144337 RepID=UPI000270D0C2|nr:helix-turn-helix domain-containing protein [Pseudomonas sp. GM78]EJN26120.1 transcriptional regulator [Pseudomonas sp. GM78]
MRLDRTVTSTETHLRRVACALFVDEGFQQVSMRRLAAVLGIQAGSLYNHMESKQALLFDVIHQYEGQLLEAVRDCAESVREPADALLRYVDTVIRFRLRHRCEATLSRLELRSLSTAQRDIITALRHQHSELLRAMLASRRGPSPFTPADDFVERCILSLLDGVIDLDSAERAVPLDRIIQNYQTFIVNALYGSARR